MSSRLVIALLLFSSFTGCRRPEPARGQAPAEDKGVAAVAVVKPEKKTVRRVVDQPAQNVEAFQHAPLYAKIPGYVGKLHVDIGDRVKAGQPLLDLAVPEMDIELKQKEALLLQAKAEVELAERNLDAAEASLKSGEAMVKQAESGRARARAEQMRVKSQHERLSKAGNVVNPESITEARFALDAAAATLEEVEAKVTAAKASRDESQAKRDKAKADVEVMKARRDVAEAGRDHSRAMLAYGRITAPFTGVVTKRHVDVGHFVQPAGTPGKPEPLLTIECMDKMRVWVLVPELEALWINRQLTGTTTPEVRIHGTGLGGNLLRGTLARSSFALDPRTRTLRTEIDLDNKEGLLRAGMYVYASIRLERKNVWTLPLSAVRRNEGIVTCFRVEGGKARTMALLVGLEGGGLIEVLKKQVGEGWEEVTGKEEIIANPPAGMKDGDEVR